MRAGGLARLKAVAHRMALRAEGLADGLLARLRPRGAAARPVLDAYRGYATPRGLVLRGRVLSALRRTAPDPTHGRWRNLREMAGLFLTDEVAGIAVVAPETGARSVSDEEGYVLIEVPEAAELPPGWHRVAVEIEGDPSTRRSFPVLKARPDARLGVVSDIDDTMMETGAYSLLRNLWTTFTGSALTRRIFPDAIVLMDHLSAHGRNPVFYVSSSPWNLHAFLDRVFARAGLVAGPMFLRDYGLGEGQFVTGTHGDHKGDAIDRVMAAHPALRFVLVGDTGQHDATVYLEAAHRHPGRVAAVVLREPGPGPGDESRRAIAALRALGVPVIHGTDFAAAPEALSAAGVAP